METELKDLVIGRKYKVKSIEWFKQNNNDDYHYRKALSHTDKEVILNNIVNEDTLVLSISCNYRDGELWLKRDAVEEIPGQPEPNKEILDAIERLKKENYIHGYDGGPGGGRSKTINTQEEPILPTFKKDGSQAIYIQVSGLKRTFAIDKINELFEKGSTKQGFQATEWTYISTELTLIKDKKTLPEDSSWSTMRD